MDKTPAVNLDVRELAAIVRRQAAVGGELSPYLLFCCPTGIDPISYDPALPPIAAYGPILCSLHGWVFRRGESPAPPYFRGDQAQLFACHALPAGAQVHAQHAGSRRWLNTHVPTWRAICAGMAQVDPDERSGYARLRLIEQVPPAVLQRFGKMRYDREAGSRTDAIIGEIWSMVLDCYDLPGVEASWSAAYRAYRSGDLIAMEALYAAGAHGIDLYWLLEGLVKGHYELFLQEKTQRTVARWSCIYVSRLDDLLPVIPTTDGKRVSLGLQYAAMYAERTNDVAFAISLCQTAIQHGLWDATQGGFAKRCVALQKKAARPQG